ncbi:MAG: 30S ribosomal protein S5 [Candidatus Berkelbacteria bacterium]|nr:30S ribosomal protein S5 [Candidatus Berkelbacteria bacterium]
MADTEKTIGEQKPERLSKNFMRPRGERREREQSEFEERVIEVRRVARTVKGGRRIRFRALVVIGNKKGKVGAAMAKANDVTEAVKKAVTKAKKCMITVPVIDGTIPYEVTMKYGSAVVMLRPAASGTSIVAGGSIELAGITDLLSKMMGSNSKINNILATMKAFGSFKEDYINKVKDYSNKRKLAETKIIENTEKPAEVTLEVKDDAESVKKAVSKPSAKKSAKKSMK